MGFSWEEERQGEFGGQEYVKKERGCWRTLGATAGHGGAGRRHQHREARQVAAEDMALLRWKGTSAPEQH